MANITTLPEEGQILVDIEDLSMLKDIKKAISIVRALGRLHFLSAGVILLTSVQCATSTKGVYMNMIV